MRKLSAQLLQGLQQQCNLKLTSIKVVEHSVHQHRLHGLQLTNRGHKTYIDCSKQISETMQCGYKTVKLSFKLLVTSKTNELSNTAWN